MHRFLFGKAMHPTLITAAGVEPVTLAQAKAQCNLEADFTDDDALLLNRLIKAASAVHRASLLTGAAWVESTWEQPLDAFPGVTARNPFAQIDLLKHPVQSVESVKYNRHRRRGADPSA